MSAPSNPPRATYRLQLNKAFTFNDAARLAPYLAELGVSHAYLSPVLKSRPGSTHGYDTVDHDMLDPELGTREDFEAMAERFAERGIGIILDIVPNHMGVGGADNALWLDVLEWGRHSLYADWFDIDWTPPETMLHDKVLVPFLGQTYGEALSAGALVVRFEPEDGTLSVWSDDAHRLPLAPKTYGLLLDGADGALGLLAQRFLALDPMAADARDAGEALKAELAALSAEDEAVILAVEERLARFHGPDGDHAAFDQLIGQQNWRLAHYSVAADDINYRRFFIVSDLAGVRVEREIVFDHVHRLIFELVEKGLVQGLRIDHIDGLIDPKGYCEALRAKCPRPIYLVVEKILAPHEALRQDWNVDGTTGYEFATRVNLLLADPEGEAPMDPAYRSFIGDHEPFEAIERAAKLTMLDAEMAAELNALTGRLRQIAMARPETVDLTANRLRETLRAVLAEMPVYRSYVDANGATAPDRRNIGVAIARARRSEPTLEEHYLDFVCKVMSADPLGEDEHPGDEVIEAAMRIQQVSGPVMAKGLEDTALYRYNRLIALNDVGSPPDRFHAGIESFHDFNRMRARTMPQGMITTSSHDSKRGEDTRLRILTLSGRADEWAAHVARWREMLDGGETPEIAADDFWLMMQMLLGAWPAEWPLEGPLSSNETDRFAERLEGAMVKSLREARLRTRWSAPDEAYEGAIGELIRRIFTSECADFLEEFRTFSARIGCEGLANALIETTLKLTVPGVPDIYQGAELWEQSMVDPDNRRSVDYERRHSMLAEAAGAQGPIDLLDWQDGLPKLTLIHRLLALRAEFPELFSRGDYLPIKVTGADAGRVLAFTRQVDGVTMLVLTSLWPWRGEVLASLVLPELPSGRCTSILGDNVPEPESDRLDVGSMLSGLPVGVFLYR
ncbi:malto-oligosyltrehalose synthase [Arsenicitalea aurantiaca]|uniref:malto-oligosyltrehalose synthase n=1 Tax=Arsenicitalea aurantiaca TaxID=1783274 RepID=UPI0013154235|nr:malto-oligosyltrehalose synthase [Arsenicitalea aurantiaca]